MTTPKQPADRKKPTRPRPKPPTTAKPAPEVPPTKSVTLKGRVIEVKKPTEEQLFAWDRVLRRLEQMAQQVENANQARRLIDKCDAIITSLIVNEDDKDWLENEQLLGNVTLKEAGSIVIDAIEAYEEELKGAPANRAARRAKA